MYLSRGTWGWLSTSLVGCVALASAAVAQGGPCHDDLAKFCKGMRPRSEESVRCLNDHLTELSAPCRERVERRAARLERRRAGATACQADIDKFCKDVQQGGGRLFQCLKDHEAELSAQCKEHVARRAQSARGERRGGGRAACRTDIDKFCKDVQQGGGRIIKCLEDHEAELSSACKEAVVRRGRHRRKGPATPTT